MRKYRRGSTFPMGATVLNRNTVQFVTEQTGEEISLVLFRKKGGREESFALTEEYRIGNLFSIVIEGLDYTNYTYCYRAGNREYTDFYSKEIVGNEGWGKKPLRLSSEIAIEEFDWEDDRPLLIPYEDSIFYQLHVRGFTRHSSSGVGKKGKVEGIVEKIGYLTELGITAVELLPAYEFRETDENNRGKLNYWGFCEGSYFSPKASYCAGKPALSFRNMVKQLHKAGIEIIMQFYFPTTVKRACIQEVLRYWMQEYHIDGFHLLGVDIPMNILISDPLLCNTKLIYENRNNVPREDGKPGVVFESRGICSDSYLYSVRRFLKGDEGSLQGAFWEMFSSSHPWRKVAYLSAYNTFTMKDMVSYDRKHNEENGEDGKDGTGDNASWNCGAEGSTRKKAVNLLRAKQIRNAMALLLFSGATPMLFAGDEFENSQKGNNNPYCQDNEISWLNWKDLKKHEETFFFLRKLIRIRKKNAALVTAAAGETKKTDLPYPTVSFHGREAWKLDWGHNQEAGSILFCSKERHLYCAINMHWEDTKLALPVLQGVGEWQPLADTALGESLDLEKDGRVLTVPARSVIILVAEGIEKNESV